MSDGTPMGTKLYDADTGAELNLPVSAITWHIDNDSPGQALIRLSIVQVEVVGEATGLTREAEALPA
ncbi:hypothetical protein [Pseudomonas sp. KCJK9000]|uniref:hypothetical protein n=1 Tax=Pseudomonas sp. KCJK9000 TaxID=3344566 RepID=UPI003906221C